MVSGGDTISWKLNSLSSTLNKALKVARHQIDFQIKPCAGVQAAEGSVRQGMRNQVDTEPRTRDLIDCQRHSIESDRAFDGDVAAELTGSLDNPAATVALWPIFNQRGDAIDMAGDQMAAQFIAQLERALQIDRGTFAPTPERGPA